MGIHRHSADDSVLLRRFDEAIRNLHAMDPSYLPAARRAEEAMCLDALHRPAEAVSVLGRAPTKGGPVRSIKAAPRWGIRTLCWAAPGSPKK